jgi:competence protein ComEA
MRSTYFSSIAFALITSAFVAVNAAPVTPQGPAATATQMAPAAYVPRININDADAATLQRELSGVGETKAKAIVAYRESSGPFASVDELLEVKGIGKAILDANREKLHVN